MTWLYHWHLFEIGGSGPIAENFFPEPRELSDAELPVVATKRLNADQSPAVYRLTTPSDQAKPSHELRIFADQTDPPAGSPLVEYLLIRVR